MSSRFARSWMTLQKALPKCGMCSPGDGSGGYELREVVVALGQSRSDAATGLLRDLASDEQTFQQLEDDLVNAIAALDTRGARELLLSFVDPDVRSIALTRWLQREDVLVSRLAELARRSSDVAVRLQQLCEPDVPELNRNVLSRIMASLGTDKALALNLNLVDDGNPSPVPRGVWDQLESAFVEQRPVGNNPNAFTLHARASNALPCRPTLTHKPRHAPEEEPWEYPQLPSTTGRDDEHTGAPSCDKA